ADAGFALLILAAQLLNRVENEVIGPLGVIVELTDVGEVHMFSGNNAWLTIGFLAASSACPDTGRMRLPSSPAWFGFASSILLSHLGQSQLLLSREHLCKPS